MLSWTMTVVLIGGASFIMILQQAYIHRLRKRFKRQVEINRALLVRIASLENERDRARRLFEPKPPRLGTHRGDTTSP